MPHLIVEYSSNVSAAVSIEKLIDDLHQATIATGIAPLAGIRTRAAEREIYRVADGDPNDAFIAIIARVGPGRTDEVKVNYITRLLDAGEQSVADTQGDLCIAWSAEIQEINAPMRINRNHIAARLAAATSEEKSNG